MKNGDRLSGKIEAVADDTIKIRVAYAPTLTIQRDQVARWRIDGMDNRKLQRLPAPTRQPPRRSRSGITQRLAI